MCINMHFITGQYPCGTDYHHLLFSSLVTISLPVCRRAGHQGNAGGPPNAARVPEMQPLGWLGPCTASTSSKVDKFLYMVAPFVFIHFCFIVLVSDNTYFILKSLLTSRTTPIGNSSLAVNSTSKKNLKSRQVYPEWSLMC